MAEILGVAAGAVGIASFVIQVADSIAKLRSFVDLVKDAPEDVTYIIEEIEILSLVLSEIGTSNVGSSSIQIAPESLSKCLSLCNRSVGMLATVVKNLEGEIRKRKRLGSFKAALKKASLDKLRDRLRTVQTMLMLSYQTYSEALQSQRHLAQLKQVEMHHRKLEEFVSNHLSVTLNASQASHSSNTRINCTATNEYSCPSSGASQRLSAIHPDSDQVEKYSACRFKNNDKASKQHRQFMARLRLPAWLYFKSCAWEICGYKSRSGWMFTAKSYRIVSQDSEIMKTAWNGDVEGMQRLFSERQASPFDRDLDGWTILDTAAYYCHPEVCRLLIAEGADPNNSVFTSALETALIIRHLKVARSEFSELLRILAPKVNSDFTHHSTDPWFYSTDNFKYLLSHSEVPATPEFSQEYLNFVLIVAAWYHHPNYASLMRLALQGRPIDAEICNARHPLTGCNILKYLAVSLGGQCSIAYERLEDRAAISSSDNDEIGRSAAPESYRISDDLTKLLKLLRELVTAGSDIFDVGADQLTPLLCIFAGNFVFTAQGAIYPVNLGFQYKVTGPGALLTGVRLWLEQLRISGVDLTTYGQKEQQIHLKHLVRREWNIYEFDIYDLSYKPIRKLRLISFTYGPSPEDWQFFLTEVMDSAFRDFWNMVDHPELGIPGAWDDMSDDDSISTYYWNSDDEGDCHGSGDDSDMGGNEGNDDDDDECNLGDEKNDSHDGEGEDRDDGVGGANTISR